MNSRFLILILILLTIDMYSYQWFKHLTQSLSIGWRISASVLFWLGTIIALFLTVMYGIGFTDKIPNSLLIYLRAAAFISYIAKFLSLPVLLIDDGRRFVGHAITWMKPSYVFDASRSKFLSTLGAFVAGVPFFTLFYGMARNAYRYQIRKIKVPIRGLPAGLEGLRIVQISDIHSGSFTAVDPIRKSIEAIQSLKPDLLFFTGDLVNYKADEVLPYLKIYEQMKGRYGSYSVFGNHDYGDYFQWDRPEDKQLNLETLKQHHAAIGWNLLLNRHEVIEINGEKLSIIGVENFSASRRFSKYGNLATAYAGVPTDSLKLLLSHDPSHWDFEINKQYQDIALTCSGHTHGFQFGIEIPGYFKWSPSQYVYDKWAGLYQAGQQFLYVNRGFGFLGYPGRVGILPEITLLELTAS